MSNAKENEQGANMGRICEEIWLVRTTSLNCGGNSGRDVCRGERGSFYMYNGDMLLLKAQQIPCTESCGLLGEHQKDRTRMFF
jgi:hypothetical protein